MKLNRIYLALASVALLATGVFIGRLSKIEIQDRASILAKSTDATSFAVNSAKGERIAVPIEGTDLTAFDYHVTVPTETNKDSQTFTFYMGFTR